MIDLKDFAARLGALSIDAQLDLSVPLPDAIARFIEKKFSPSARGPASSYVWSHIQDAVTDAEGLYAEVHQGWLGFAQFQDIVAGGVVDISRVRTQANGWGCFSIMISALSMAGVCMVVMVSGPTAFPMPFGLALAISLLFFLIHIWASRHLKRGRRQLRLAQGHGPDDVRRLEALEHIWSDARPAMAALVGRLNAAVNEASSLKSVRKGEAYDRLLDAEADVHSRRNMATYYHTRMLGAQARLASAFTEEDRRKAQSDFDSCAWNYESGQRQLSKAEAHLNLARAEYGAI